MTSTKSPEKESFEEEKEKEEMDDPMMRAIMFESRPSIDDGTEHLLPSTDFPPPPHARKASITGSGGSYTSIYIPIWMVCSVTVIMFNKYLLATLDFPYPVFLTTMHLVASTIGVNILLRFTHLVDGVSQINMTRPVYIRTILPIGILFSCSLVSSNYAYLTLSVSFVQMLKASIPCAVLLMSFVIGSQQVNRTLVFVVILISTGSAVAAHGEIHFVLSGFLAQCAAIVFEATRLVLVNNLLKDLKMNPLVSLYYFAPLCAGINSLVIPFTEGLAPFYAMGRVGFGVLAANAGCAFVLNVAALFLISAGSGLLLAVSGIAKDILLISGSTLILGSTIAPTQVFGYCLSICGLTMFAMHRNGVATKDLARMVQFKGPSRFVVAAGMCVAAVGALLVSGHLWNAGTVGGMGLARPVLGSQLVAETGLTGYETFWDNHKPILGKHTEPVSIVFLAGEYSDRGLLKVLDSILHFTVGPYELIGVFTADENDIQNIADIVLDRHIKAQVDFPGRGLIEYRSVFREYSQVEGGLAASQGLSLASHGHTIFLTAEKEIAQYGWDRTLLMAIKSSDKLLAVSGSAAGNIHHSDATIKPAFADIVGSLNRSAEVPVHYPNRVELRHWAARAPIIYNTHKARSLGSIKADFEEWSLGDVELCLRGHESGSTCGYYPISTMSRGDRQRGPWEYVEGSPMFENDTSMSPGQVVALQSAGLKLSVASTETVPFLSSNPLYEDIPRTIVTCFSGNHQNTLMRFYDSTGFAEGSRIVIYRMASGDPIDMSRMAHWTNVEWRDFDFAAYPPWMNLNVNRGFYAWKAMMLQEVMQDYGGLISWNDAGNKLFESFDEAGHWTSIASSGIYSSETQDEITTWTHPAMIAYLGVPRPLLSFGNCNGAIIGINTQHGDAMQTVIRRWLDCASRRECIGPVGSNMGNHRQDQSALTLLMALNGFVCARMPPWALTQLDNGDWAKEQERLKALAEAAAAEE